MAIGMGVLAVTGYSILSTLAAYNGWNQAGQPAPSVDPRADNIRRIGASLSAAQREARDAVLMCEHQRVIDKLRPLVMADASQAQISQRWRLISDARQAIQRLDASSDDGNKYWEDCMGYQLYDDHDWPSGQGYSGSFFAAASKRCRAPALQINAYADKDRKNRLHTQWVAFIPDPQSGLAERVFFAIPREGGPGQGQFWWDFKLRCNGGA